MDRRARAGARACPSGLKKRDALKAEAEALKKTDRRRAISARSSRPGSARSGRQAPPGPSSVPSGSSRAGAGPRSRRQKDGSLLRVGAPRPTRTPTPSPCARPRAGSRPSASRRCPIRPARERSRPLASGNFVLTRLGVRRGDDSRCRSRGRRPTSPRTAGASARPSTTTEDRAGASTAEQGRAAHRGLPARASRSAPAAAPAHADRHAGAQRGRSPGHTLGRFRLSATSSPNPGAACRCPRRCGRSWTRRGGPHRRADEEPSPITSGRSPPRSTPRATARPRCGASWRHPDPHRDGHARAPGLRAALDASAHPRQLHVPGRARVRRDARLPAAASRGPARQPARPRLLAGGRGEPADRARDREPLLGAALRPRPGRDERGLRHPGRAADPSGAARLAGHRVHRARAGA